jgi:hypothetical protein
MLHGGRFSEWHRVRSAGLTCYSSGWLAVARRIEIFLHGTRSQLMQFFLSLPIR